MAAQESLIRRVTYDPVTDQIVLYIVQIADLPPNPAVAPDRWIEGPDGRQQVRVQFNVPKPVETPAYRYEEVLSEDAQTRTYYRWRWNGTAWVERTLVGPTLPF
jgi:hypothetical protein